MPSRAKPRRASGWEPLTGRLQFGVFSPSTDVDESLIRSAALVLASALELGSESGTELELEWASASESASLLEWALELDSESGTVWDLVWELGWDSASESASQLELVSELDSESGKASASASPSELGSPSASVL